MNILALTMMVSYIECVYVRCSLMWDRTVQIYTAELLYATMCMLYTPMLLQLSVHCFE
jgi:hypothetical protein